MEDDLVEGFDDAHIVDARVEVVVGERLELAAEKPVIPTVVRP